MELPQQLGPGVSKSIVERLRNAGCGVTYTHGQVVLIPTDEASRFACDTAYPLVKEHHQQLVMYLSAEDYVRNVN